MPDLVTLGFDTSAAHCAAALLTGDRLIALRSEAMDKGQSARLMPLIAALLADAGMTVRDLDVIGVGTGPGNFTGIRIAVAAARGLALALDIPAIGVGATDALAHGLPRPCRIVIPGRRDMVIWQDFDSTESTPAQGPADALPPGPAPATPVLGIAEGIARIALIRARSGQPQPRPAPIYLRPADAAPARDRGPQILP